MKKILTFSFLSFLLMSVYGQNVGVGTLTPDASAKLDISAADKGLLIPRINLTALNSASPITSPATGLMVYNTNTTLASGEGFYYWNGSTWIKFSTGVVSTKANNGLSVSNDTVQMGGNLIKNTTITQSNFNLIHDLTGTGNFEVRKSGATDLFISGTNGNIGIGTANPTRAILEQNGLVANTAAIFGGNTTGVALIASWPGIYFNAYENGSPRAIANGFSSSMITNPSDGTIYIRTHSSGTTNAIVSPSSRITILNNGNVGIGATNPAVKFSVNGNGANIYGTDIWSENNLHVQGNETLAQGGGRGRLRIGTAWGYEGMYAETSSLNIQNDLVLGASSGIVRVGPGGAIGQILSIQNGGVAANLAFTQHPFQSSGSQTITNSTDQYTLQVGAFIGSSGSRFQSFTAGQTGNWTQLKLGWYNPTGTTTLNVYNGEGTGGTLLSTMTITKAPGLQTYTFPTSIPVVAGNKYTFEVADVLGSLWVGTTYSGGYYSGNSGVDIWFEEILASMNVSSFVVTSAENGGRVGINTHQPTEKLDVRGNVRFTGALMPNNIAGTTGQILTSAGAGLSPTWTNAAAALGTDTDTNDGLMVNYPNINVNVSNGISLANDNVKLGGTLDQATTITQGNFDLINDLTGTGNFEVRKSGATDLFISGTNGNIGIGASTPAVKFAIGGNGTNAYATDVWVENNLHVQGNETMTQGGRGRLRVGSAWAYNGLYAELSSTGVTNDLVLGASSGQVRIGPGGASQQNLSVSNGQIISVLNNSTNFPLAVYNTNANGTASTGAGNNVGVTYLTGGSGGAFSGTQVGAFGYAVSTNTTILRAGGLFGTFNLGVYAYVGCLTATNVARKIEGNGTVNTTVKDLNENNVVLSAPEAPENLFEDYGKGQLSNGFAHIDLDPIFAKNIIVNSQHDLRVFIQLEGDCKGVFVMNKTANSFEVKELNGGTSNTHFTYHIVANRADEVLPDGSISRYSMERFAPAIGAQSIQTIKNGAE